MVEQDWPLFRAICIEGISTGNATFENRSRWALDAGHLRACRLVHSGEGVLGWRLSVRFRAVRVRGVAEVSVYVARRQSRGQGVGTKLIGSLIEASGRRHLDLAGGIFRKMSSVWNCTSVTDFALWVEGKAWLHGRALRDVLLLSAGARSQVSRESAFSEATMAARSAFEDTAWNARPRVPFCTVLSLLVRSFTRGSRGLVPCRLCADADNCFAFLNEVAPLRHMPLAAYIFCSHWLRQESWIDSSKTAFTSVARSIESILLTNDSTRANSSSATLAPGLAGTLELLTVPEYRSGMRRRGCRHWCGLLATYCLFFCNFLARSPREGES